MICSEKRVNRGEGERAGGGGRRMMRKDEETKSMNERESESETGKTMVVFLNPSNDLLFLLFANIVCKIKHSYFILSQMIYN